jgi:hypothetical protein
MMASGSKPTDAALSFSTVLQSLCQPHTALCAASATVPKLPVATLCSSLFGLIIWELQSDLQAYITSQMSQHAHQEGSMAGWEEQDIWQAPEAATS